LGEGLSSRPRRVCCPARCVAGGLCDLVDSGLCDLVDSGPWRSSGFSSLARLAGGICVAGGFCGLVCCRAGGEIR